MPPCRRAATWCWCATGPTSPTSCWPDCSGGAPKDSTEGAGRCFVTEEASELRQVLSQLPNLPGVYRMIGADDALLYVGKAGDLKKRVGSYFNKGPHAPRIAHMIER